MLKKIASKETRQTAVAIEFKSNADNMNTVRHEANALSETERGNLGKTNVNELATNGKTKDTRILLV
jgi:hypothetical protein